MDPKNQQPFNANTPISEVLKQEQTGYTPSAPKTPRASLSDVISAMSGGGFDSINYAKPINNFTKREEMLKTPNYSGPVAQAAPVMPAGSVAPTQAAGAAQTAYVPAAQTVSPVKIIKTYRGDAEEAVKNQQATIAKIAIAEERQRRELGIGSGEGAQKKYGLVILVVVLIVLGAAAIPTVQYILNKKTAEVPVVVQKTIVPGDKQRAINLDNVTREELISKIDSLWTKQPVSQNIEFVKISENIVDTEKKTTTQKEISADVFASLIGPNMPNALARSFDSDYMYGAQNPSNPKFFLVFKTSSYEQTFANILRWEDKITTDLSQILNISSDTLGRPFVDRVITNKDVRAITATDGSILLLYGFLDNKTLLITTNQDTFQELNSKYIASRFVQ